MKPHQMSYVKTVIAASVVGTVLMCMAIGMLVFGSDLARLLNVPLLNSLATVIPIGLILPVGFCYAIAIGGVLSLYRDVSRAGRP